MDLGKDTEGCQRYSSAKSPLEKTPKRMISRIYNSRLMFRPIQSVDLKFSLDLAQSVDTNVSNMY